MGRALVGGMLGGGVIEADSLQLVEPSDESRAWWGEHHPKIVSCDLASAISASDTVLLAVKPNIVSAIAKQKGRFWSGKLVDLDRGGNRT